MMDAGRRDDRVWLQQREGARLAVADLDIQTLAGESPIILEWMPIICD